MFGWLVRWLVGWESWPSQVNLGACTSISQVRSLVGSLVDSWLGWLEVLGPFQGSLGAILGGIKLVGWLVGWLEVFRVVMGPPVLSPHRSNVTVVLLHFVLPHDPC